MAERNTLNRWRKQRKKNILVLICHGRVDEKIERVIITETKDQIYHEGLWHLKTEYFKGSSTKTLLNWKCLFITGSKCRVN